MIGKTIGLCLALYLGAFTLVTGVLIIKELITRKRAASMKGQNTDEKEADESND